MKARSGSQGPVGRTSFYLLDDNFERMLNEQGHQAATIWNVKVVLRSGRNGVTLSPDNAAFTGN